MHQSKCFVVHKESGLELLAAAGCCYSLWSLSPSHNKPVYNIIVFSLFHHRYVPPSRLNIDGWTCLAHPHRMDRTILARSKGFPHKKLCSMIGTLGPFDDDDVIVWTTTNRLLRFIRRNCKRVPFWKWFNPAVSPHICKEHNIIHTPRFRTEYATNADLWLIDGDSLGGARTEQGDSSSPPIDARPLFLLDRCQSPLTTSFFFAAPATPAATVDWRNVTTPLPANKDYYFIRP